MRKLGHTFLTGTMLTAVASFTVIVSAQADPLRLAQAAACPQGQVGTPPNCKPAPRPQPPARPQPPPPRPQPPAPHPQPPQHPPVQQPQRPPVQQPQRPPVQPPQHPPVQQPQHPPVQPPQHPPVQQPQHPPVQQPQHPPVQQPQHPPVQQPQRPPVQQPQHPPVQQPQRPQVQPPQHPQVQQPQRPQVQPPQQPQVQQPHQPQQPQPPQGGARLRPPPPPTLPAPGAAQAKPLERHNGPAALVPTTRQGQPIRNVNQLRAERHQNVVGGNTVITEGNRVIVRQNNGAMVIRHDDVDRFRYGARDVKVERRGNDHITTVLLGNGTRVVTTLGPDGRIVRRSRFDRNGREVVLIGAVAAAVLGATLYVDRPPPVIHIPRDRYIVDLESAPPNYAYDAFTAPPVEQIDQAYSLDQVLDSPSLRDLMPSVNLDTITFETGSWEVAPDQVDRLSVIAEDLNKIIGANPQEVFLVEGHTDAVGNDVDNMSLSDRRAETVALILSDKFGVPPENLVTQGYGSQFLRVSTQGAERRNRRVTLRRITPLLAGK
jgi:outer membrane protein OmpA-like peptidoglycan-associated protein